MITKTQIYAQMAEEAANQISGNREQWTAFLTTAARLYKYSYPDQLLIYKQKPNATACAEYKIWNDTMRRYVIRGSKGIALVDNSGERPRLRHVFDVSDTGETAYSRPVKLWKMLPEYEAPVMEALEKEFNVPAQGTSLDMQLSNIAEKQAEDYWDNHKKQIIDIVEDSYLSEYDELNIKAAFKNAAATSITYALYARCMEHADNYFEPEDFVDVFEFNTSRAINVLGTAVSDSARAVFREIEVAIRTQERNKQMERSQYDRDNAELQGEWRLPDTGRGITGDGGSAPWQVREDETSISGREQSDSLQRLGTQGEAVHSSAGNRPDSETQNGADDDTALKAEPSTGQKDQSDGLGTASKQPEGTGGRSDNGGTYQQLSLNLFATEEEQKNYIEQEAESEKVPSAFSFSQEEFHRALRDGSGFTNGKLRIKLMYEHLINPKERADYLKNEYGIGGHSYTLLDGSAAFLDSNAKGLHLRSYDFDYEKNYSWSEVEKGLRALIDADEYFSETDRTEYAKLEETYAEFGGIPFASSAHNFPTPDELRKQSAPEDVKVSAENSNELSETEIEAQPEVESEPKLETDIPPNIPKQNFRITDDKLGTGGPKEKFRINMEAISLLQDLEVEHREATPEEQSVLSKYVGWGGLSDVFDANKSAWASEYKELEAALSPEEYAAARASTLNAHYTSPTVIRAIYDAVGQMGFRAGNILEPSMGVGNFFGLLPEQMKGSHLYGVELDSLTGRMAKKLYPLADIKVAGFETTDNRDFYDLAVGNVPFGQYKVADKAYDKLGFSIHDYFFAKTLDQVRAGGIVAFITTRYTMDKQTPDVRKYLAQRAELLGAIRLPNNAFKANAGTEVVSDILFLQKRERPIDIEPDWVHLGIGTDGLAMNSYFVENPHMVLGEIHKEMNQYGREDLNVVPVAGADLSVQLKEAITHIGGNYQAMEQIVNADEPVSAKKTIAADPNVKNFSYTVVDGDVYFRENSIMKPVELNETAKERIKGMVTLREVVGELIEYQLNDYPEEMIQAKQQELSACYDAFSAKYGLINSRGNAQAFDEDSSYYLLCSLENVDEDGKLESKADMFTKRTIRPEIKVTSVDTPSEALAVSIGERGGVDLPFMAELTDMAEDEVAAALSGVIFRVPHRTQEDGRAVYVTADEYLSGNVREKLREAQEAVKTDAGLVPNVKALEQAQPKDLEASEIDVRLGATWIDRADIQQFMHEQFETPYYLKRSIEVNFSPVTAEWRITGKSQPSYSDVAANITYGTSRANAYRILEDTLNLKDIRIYDTIEDADGKHRVLNKKETTLAGQKQQAIKDAFQDWVWQDPKRRERLVTQYNETFNATRPREYDGTHINFVGMNPAVRLREHQKNAIAHVLYGGNTLLAHEVGAGKTFEMAASAMESKRLGLCQKSMFVVPNHLTLQWANEFLHLYPSAKLLVASKKDFETKNRKKFCARIATGNYDAVIIGHSQFEKIPISPERQERLLREQIDEIETALYDLKQNRGENFSIKQMEKTRKSLQIKLDKLTTTERKDDVITFEQLGVDRLFVDESQAFKNLFLYTKMRNVAGLSTSEAQRSSDMFLKCRYMDELTNNKGVIFASGTPVSNSMTELYTVMRYLQYDTLRDKGMSHFDCWASTFGETTTAIELAPEGTGYRARTRFAKFFNLPELMSMFKDVADIKTSDQLHLPVPEAKFETVVVQPSEHQKDMVASLSERAAEVHSGSVDPTVDNMLRITSDGRKLGLDQRLMNPLLPDDPDSKLNACVKNVYEIWEEGKGEKLTQLLFCDLSTPKNDGSFNVYDDVRGKLLAKGIPAEEIAYIHTADTEAKKKELFAKVRTGQVRVLLGSTQKMGAGTNVQDKLVAVHHLDVGWRPSDMTQRNGRIIRQGNRNPEVKIFQYVTEGTFDAYLYQTLENKQKFISQIMTSKSPVRSCEDVDEQSLSYAEIKALCAGNPMIKQKMDLDIDVARLKVLKSDHKSQQYRLEDQLLKKFPAQIEKQKDIIRGLEVDKETVALHELPKEDFIGMRIGDSDFSEKDKAGAALLDLCKTVKGSETVPVGLYRGFAMELSYSSMAHEFTMTLKGEISHQVTLGTDARGNLTRIDNALAGVPERLEVSKERLDNLYHQQEAAKAELGKPFPQEAELAEKSAKLAELDAALNMDSRGGGEPTISEEKEDGVAAEKAETGESKIVNSFGERASVLADLKARAGQVVPPVHKNERGEVAL